MNTISKDSENIIYKYQHNLHMVDVVKELNTRYTKWHWNGEFKRNDDTIFYISLGGERFRVTREYQRNIRRLHKQKLLPSCKLNEMFRGLVRGQRLDNYLMYIFSDHITPSFKHETQMNDLSGNHDSYTMKNLCEKIRYERQLIIPLY